MVRIPLREHLSYEKGLKKGGIKQTYTLNQKEGVEFTWTHNGERRLAEFDTQREY